MQIFFDERCVDYGTAARPEQPARLERTAPLLRDGHPNWNWSSPPPAHREDAARVHTDSLLDRLSVTEDFDGDTPWFESIEDHAYRASGCAIAAATAALVGKGPAFSLMRPPGHHATPTHAMGFCYLNHIALAAAHAQSMLGATRVAVWDFDAHHGNGTQDILLGRDNTFFASVHQSPCYPGTGLASVANCENFPVAPRVSAAQHLDILRTSWERVVAFAPDLVLVSAGFDAYIGDPITEMTLEKTDFATLGSWLPEAACPVAAVLEGGYSSDLPELVDAFLAHWVGGPPTGA